MSFDFLLANLLFGMTLLTASMAAAYFIGDYLADRMRISRKSRVVVRVMSLLSCTLLSLLLFLVKLSGPELNKAFAPGAGNFEPRLSKKVKVSEGKEAATPSETAEDLSWTFINVISPETLSELKSQTQILKASGRWSALASRQWPKECGAWMNQLQQLGISAADVSSVPQAADARLFVCVAEKHSPATWQAIRELVVRGGSVFFVGRFNEPDSATLSQLLQIKSWRKPDARSVQSFVFGGNLFSYGGMPPGLKIGVSEDWSHSELQGVVAADGENMLWSDGPQSETNFTSFITRSHAKGRVAWTSLPASLSEKNKYLYGEYWNLAVVRTMSYLTRAPVFGVSANPVGVKTVVVPVVHAEYEFKQARDLQEQFDKLKIPASYFAVMSEALNDRSTLKKMSAQEIGASSFNHNPIESMDFFDRVMQFQKWKESFANLGFNLATNAGALTLANAARPGDGLAAAMATRFSYAVGDPFNNSFVPQTYALRKTSEMKQALLDKNFTQLKTGSDEVVVLPIATGDDFVFYQDGQMSDTASIERGLQRKAELSRWTGGPLVLGIHTQVLGSEEGQTSLAKAVKQFHDAGATFYSARDYVQWWQNKSSLDIQTERISNQEIVIRVMNVGVERVSAFSLLNSESENWKLATESALVEAQDDGRKINFKGLESGESFSVVFKKRSL